MKLSERGMAAALGALRRLAAMDVLDRLGVREQVERAVYAAARNGGRVAGAANRSFAKAARTLPGPARQAPAPTATLFDLTPTDEQQMLVAAVRDFAAERVRPVAAAADANRATPDDVLAQSTELGLLVLGVAPDVGGVVDERCAVTSVLAAEALAHGDLSIATACLAPAAVSTALSLWGDADQQGTYLTAFTGANPPAAALAVLEPRPLFDPFAPATRARRHGSDLVLDGVKSLVPRAASAEVLLVAAEVDGSGPGLILVEAGAEGVFVSDEPAMGLRAAATGQVALEQVRVPVSALLADGDPAVYAEAVHRSRLAWCALTVGTGRAVLDYVIPYVNERVAFGEPISHRQSVAFAVADMAVELEGMRLLAYRAASRADQGRPFAREVALARALCVEKAMRIASDGVQLLGGHGYVKEHPVERWYRDLRAAALMEGALVV